MLLSNVCFNIAFGVTYVAGCSDVTYQHPTCPYKFEDIETPWLGMAYCNGTSNEWVLCDQKKKPATLTKPDPCWCPKDENDRPKRLRQSSIIQGTASLPTKALGSIQFSVGYYPTVNPNPKITSTTASPTASDSSSTPSTASPAPTAADTTTDSIPTDNPSDEGSLSPSARIGAIAGGVAGALVIALLLAGFLCFRRRQRRQQLQREEEARTLEDFMHGETKGGAASEPDPVNIGIAVGGAPSPSTASSPDTAALSELDSKAARPWSLRSELDNNSSARSSYGTAGGGGHGGAGQARPAPSELAAHPIAELPG
ncbi:hypothetical protein SLS63_010753 [Diaporthe eres]|uniref:Uncharacterized protein n=1 Tax=Diaporthe eres TaxID=83184 RepID=A0ABR1NW24_DIAER